MNAITLSSVQDSLTLEGTDLEGYLAHHHDMILLTAIEESRQIGENYLYEMQQRYFFFAVLCSSIIHKHYFLELS